MRTQARRILIVSSLLLMPAVFVTIGCGSGRTDGSGGSSKVKTGVTGAVLDADGAALAGVSVSAAGASATTSSNGTFVLEIDAGPAVVSFSLAGHLPSQKRVTVLDGKPTGLEVRLRKMEAPVQLDVTVGGSIAGLRGAALVAGAGAFVTGGGADVQGMVDIHLTPLDPSDEADLSSAPGDFSATGADGELVQLESFGMLDVTVMQGAEQLDIRSGTKVTVTLPGPANPTGDIPETIALWSFDEATARWKEEGTATYDAASNSYTGEIGHLSMWNCDKPLEATCIKGRVKDNSGAAVAGAWVVAKGVDYMGSSSATADAAGEFCVAVRKSSKVRVNAVHPDGGGTIREVESGAEDTTLPPQCDDPRCKDVGEWVIDKGKVVTSTGDTIDCGDVENPFAGTCAVGMFDMMTCFRPAGACVFKQGGTTEWENGAKIVYSSGRMGGQGQYLSPTGQVCGTFDFTIPGPCADGGCTNGYKCEDEYCQPQAGAQLGTIAGGNKTFAIVYDDDEETALQCPDGTLISMDDEASDVYEACTGNQQGSSSEPCTWEGGGPGPSGCTSDADCTGDQACCDYGSGLTFCISPLLCQSPCTADSDCQTGQRCCDVGTSVICLAVESCPSQ